MTLPLKLIEEIRARPELTAQDLIAQLINIPPDTIVRIDMGVSSGTPSPEDQGLISQPSKYGQPGNNIRWFGVSDVVNGIVKIEL